MNTKLAGADVDESASSVHIVYETIAEAIGHLYKDKVIQIYLGESGGSTHYSDFDIEQKIYMEGKVLWTRGNVIALESIIETQDGKTYPKTVLVNAWAVTSVMEKEKDGVEISMVMKGMRR